MSMIPYCGNCSDKLDPFGRDGGNARCAKCIDAQEAQEALRSITIAQMAGEPIEERPLGDGWHRWAA